MNSKQHFFNELKKYSNNENLFKNEWIQISKHKKESPCICGHIIHHYAYVYNIENGHILTIGVGCCKKYGITQISNNILLLEFFEESGSLFYKNGMFDINRDIDFIQFLNNKIDRIQKMDKENLGTDIKFYLREIEVIKQNLEELIHFYHFYCGQNILIKTNQLLETLEDFNAQHDVEEKIASLPCTPVERKEDMDEVIDIIREIISNVETVSTDNNVSVPTENNVSVPTENNVSVDMVQTVPTIDVLDNNISVEMVQTVPTIDVLSTDNNVSVDMVQTIDVLDNNVSSEIPPKKYNFKNESFNQLLEDADKVLENSPKLVSQMSITIEIANHYASETTRRLRKLKEGIRELRLGFEELNRNIAGLNKNIV